MEKIALTPEIYASFEAYSKKYFAWGNLHIVLEDLNLETYNVEWCLDEAIRVGDVEGMKLAFLLLQLTRTQRGRIAKRIKGNYDVPHISKEFPG